jgi:hypothetical protein
MLVAVGATMADPETPAAANPAPVHDVALVELQLKVEDCPEEMELGLAARVAVAAPAGAEPNAPVVQGARLPLPQQVLNQLLEGVEGFEVWPQGSSITILFVDSDKVGAKLLTALASNVA